MRKLLPFYIIVFFFLSCNTGDDLNFSQAEGLQVSKSNKWYWSYNGKNVLLLGGSVEDNLFQVPAVTNHLDLLKRVGGNYVRCTMSSRDSGNVWPFNLNEEGKYDLNSFNSEYWDRFKEFLHATHEREIFVQVEIWATFDFYRDNWLKNPFNPANNINYDEQRSKLSAVVDSHPIYTGNNFFRSVPSQMAIARVLEYQQKFVDKLLSVSLDYDHVLYCMDNETSVTSDWGKFWANYIRKKAHLRGKSVHTTEMWDPWDLSHAFHSETFDNPHIFSFVDISQNNHITGEEHWINGLKQLEHLKQMEMIRPVNNIKVYGNDGGRHKTTRDGIESFIKNVFMGCASTRFHRPSSGQGLNPDAQAVIMGVRQLSDRMDFFNGKPCNYLLTDRAENEAYCRGIPGREHAIYFTDGGEVKINLGDYENGAEISWLDILNKRWMDKEKLEPSFQTVVKCPGKGHWIALIKGE